MLTAEQAQVGAKVAIPTQKTAGVSFENFAAEMAGCELVWDTVKKEFYRWKKRPLRDVRNKPYALPYLIIKKVSTFADTNGTCITLGRGDAVEWFGADMFAAEDLTIYTEPA